MRRIAWCAFTCQWSVGGIREAEISSSLFVCQPLSANTCAAACLVRAAAIVGGGGGGGGGIVCSFRQ